MTAPITTAKFRAKPVIHEAYRFDPATCGRELPPGINGIASPGADSWDYEGCQFWIQAPLGRIRVKPGDWIVSVDGGATYPCSPETFEHYYEPADTPAPQPPAACSGLTARWCPTHGACVCDDESLDAEHCPLHRTSSSHAEEQPPAADGWIPLVPGCAMPEQHACVVVTVVNPPYTAHAIYSQTAFGVTMGDDRTVRDGFSVNGKIFCGPSFERDLQQITAWKPAPAPYRGGV